jgi:ATP-dependent Clp protease, protease subunit
MSHLGQDRLSKECRQDPGDDVTRELVGDLAEHHDLARLGGPLYLKEPTSIAGTSWEFTQSIVEPEKGARLRHHPSILRDPDETPENPDAPDNGDRKPTEGLVNELESRLFKALVDESAKPIQIYVNSPGGHVESGDSIHDIIKFVRSTVPIYMIGTGWVASAGVLIYLAGENKMRFCLPNTRFLLHQPMGGVHGPATDIEIEARELVKMHERLVQIIATDTGQSVERVRKDTDRNYWMSASEAIDYGVANKIISSIRDLK